MYLLKSAYTDQTATISKLLKEDWEPFAVLQVKVKEGPKLRMYFRKYDSEPITATMHSVIDQVKLDGDEFAATFNKIMSEWANSFFDRLNDIMNLKINIAGGPDYPVKAKQDPDGNWVVAPASEEDEETETVDREDDINTLVRENTTTQLLAMAMATSDREVNDLRGMTKRELATVIVTTENNKVIDTVVAVEQSVAESEQPTRITDAPDGDGFRVVDEIPNDLTAMNNRTPKQDATIEKLKNEHGNISILPGGDGGEVRVMAGADIYTIKTDGNFMIAPTGANTNAVG